MLDDLIESFQGADRKYPYNSLEDRLQRNVIAVIAEVEERVSSSKVRKSSSEDINLYTTLLGNYESAFGSSTSQAFLDKHGVDERRYEDAIQAIRSQLTRDTSLESGIKSKVMGLSY